MNAVIFLCFFFSGLPALQYETMTAYPRSLCALQTMSPDNEGELEC